jgi:ABC-type multidrug transport system ATPase subunit
VPEGVTCKIQGGEEVGLGGLNGAGKTLFFRCIPDQAVPTNGPVRILPFPNRPGFTVQSLGPVFQLKQPGDPAPRHTFSRGMDRS